MLPQVRNRRPVQDYHLYTSFLWIWEAYERSTKRLIDWECGDRDEATAQRLINRLQAWGARLYCADEYVVYTGLISVARLYQGKDQTLGVERTNASQRHWFARFRRRSIVVSKAIRMVDATVALFARFCTNGSIDELLSIFA